jgi:hypothetical protein
VNLSEGGLFELAILGDVGAFDVALPAVLEAPGSGIGVPEDAGGKDAPRERKGGGIELEEERLANSLRSGSKNW